VSRAIWLQVPRHEEQHVHLYQKEDADGGQHLLRLSGTLKRLIAVKNVTNFLIFTQFQDDVDFIEKYDIKGDPYQLYNLGKNVGSVEKGEFQERMDRLKSCRGSQQCYHHNHVQNET
jgi:hypothetical protein